MIVSLCVGLHFLRGKQHVAELPRGVHLGLVGEMRRGGVAAFAAGHDGLCVNRRAEFDGGNEAVARRTVDPFGLARLCRVEGGQGAPLGRREPYRQTWLGIVEGLYDVVGAALKAVDLSPGRLPATEILL